MRELVAIDLPAGPAFVDALLAIWDAGDAALPIDRRLPPSARQIVLEVAEPHAVIANRSGERIRYEPGAPPVQDGDALVISTSGSTGEPKAIVHTFDSLTAHARGVNRRLAIDPGADRWLSCLPLNHLGGLGVVVRSILTDTPIDLLEGFEAEAVSAAPQQLGSTLTSLVPTALDRVDPGAYRWVVLGGSADVGERPDNVVRTYGLTETGGGVVYDGFALEGIDVRIDDDGVVALRGPSMARGRRIGEGAVVSVVDDDGWLVTGDIGERVGDRLVVHGRQDELIVSGGENVWPHPVEEAIRTHPGVDEVSVFGRVDPEWGHRVVAIVVPMNPMWPPTLGELRDHVRELLPAYAAPRELLVVDGFEHTSLGKVKRPHLEDEARIPDAF